MKELINLFKDNFFQNILIIKNHTGSIMGLWTCKADVQWKWCFYTSVLCSGNLWWILSPFVKLTFCDLLGHLKFCHSGFSLYFELTYSQHFSSINDIFTIAFESESDISFDVSFNNSLFRNTAFKKLWFRLWFALVT